MAAPTKYDENVRAFIHQAVNEERRAATSILTELEHKHGVKPSLAHVREIARQERKAHAQDITTQPKDQQLQALVAGLVKATHAEIERILADDGPTDADQLLKLTRTTRELEPILKPEPQNKGNEDTPKGLLSSLTRTDTGTDRKRDATHQDPVRAAVARMDAVNTGLEAA